MEIFSKPVQITKDIQLGIDKPLLIGGPCAVESYDICIEIAEKLKNVCESFGFNYIFKASFDKANRTSAKSFRSIGMDESLAVIEKVKRALEVPALTDVHESHQVASVSQVVDILQVPAFLCRQTDLLIACASSGKAVNIKRGQFMAPEDMQYAVDKVNENNQNLAFLTERGVSFGYHNLVVDMRALPVMRQFAPVIFDTTHSVQQPGGAGGSSGGQREFAPYLARAAGAAGVDGFFMETHPEPAKALSDGPNMIPLSDVENFVIMLKKSWELGSSYTR